MSLNAPYNPYYDPILDATPGTGTDYAPTYWVDSAGITPQHDGQLQQDVQADVAIIGSGFTGLCAALFLAKEHNIKAVVLEANGVAHGCSTRSGGQGQLACGRLSRSEWIQKWGIETAKQMHAEVYEGLNTFTSLIADEKIDCDASDRGHLYIAHNQHMLSKLQKESHVCNELFQYATSMLDLATVHSQYVKEQNCVGALLEPEGVGIHPAKLAFNYANLAKKYGATIHTSSPVVDWLEEGGKQKLITPTGTVTAAKVVITTGGYTSQHLHKVVAYRSMPILSNSVVTRVLTKDEIEACGFQTTMVITDTRILRFYYRLLPDNRLQIGTRSAITGRDADAATHYNLLVDGMTAKFPALKGIKIEYSWWGWVDVSHDMMPRIVQSQNKQVFYAFGYGGNGVSFSAHAGKRVAQLVTDTFDIKLKQLPIYNSPLPRFWFPPIRRMGQKMAYIYYHALDVLRK